MATISKANPRREKSSACPNSSSPQTCNSTSKMPRLPNSHTFSALIHHQEAFGSFWRPHFTLRSTRYYGGWREIRCGYGPRLRRSGQNESAENVGVGGTIFFSFSPKRKGSYRNAFEAAMFQDGSYYIAVDLESRYLVDTLLTSHVRRLESWERCASAFPGARGWDTFSSHLPTYFLP